MENIELNMAGPISNLQIAFFDESVKAAKYSYRSNIEDLNSEVTPGINNLGLAVRGSAHDSFLKGIAVQFDLTFTVKAWTEFERYHFADIVMSQSTIHRIAGLASSEDNFIEYVDDVVLNRMKELVEAYKAAEGEEKQALYLKLLYSCPTGIKLTARITANYLALKTIYKQRCNHLLPEWRDFCEQLKSLPHSEWITTKGEENA